jgi:hypothetical protein
MKIGNWLAAATLLFAVSGLASAQGDIAKVDKGTTEYDIAGNIHFDKPSTQSIQLRWAPFINQNIQWGIDFTLDHAQDAHPSTFGFVGAIANYYFRNSAMASDTLPYAGVAIGTDYGSGNNQTVWGLQAGVKHFLNPNVAIFGELDWRRANKNGFFNGRRSNTDLNFGLAFFR